jgi:gliding motility-associated lipoprotein GldH
VKRIIYLIILLIVVITSCKTLDVFEQTKAFANHEWQTNDKPSFTFEIKDTSVRYNLYIVLRHEDAYRYKDIWLDVQMKSPDSTVQIKRDFTLADNTKWLGSAMSDIVEHRINFNAYPVSFKKGMYTFTLQQVMREEPLQYILNAGIRVEKVKP